MPYYLMSYPYSSVSNIQTHCALPTIAKSQKSAKTAGASETGYNAHPKLGRQSRNGCKTSSWSAPCTFGRAASTNACISQHANMHGSSEIGSHQSVLKRAHIPDTASPEITSVEDLTRPKSPPNSECAFKGSIQMPGSASSSDK